MRGPAPKEGRFDKSLAMALGLGMAPSVGRASLRTSAATGASWPPLQRGAQPFAKKHWGGPGRTPRFANNYNNTAFA